MPKETRSPPSRSSQRSFRVSLASPLLYPLHRPIRCRVIVVVATNLLYKTNIRCKRKEKKRKEEIKKKRKRREKKRRGEKTYVDIRGEGEAEDEESYDSERTTDFVVVEGWGGNRGRPIYTS